jgi:hypothetical protein
MGHHGAKGAEESIRCSMQATPKAFASYLQGSDPWNKV